MPSYISHAIMGEELYNKSNIDNKLFAVPISKEQLKGYSLGIDLSLLSTKTICDPHNRYTRDFFISMLKYIKERKLTENIDIMSLLYGHIGHYFLDTNTHPFIYYIELGCQKVGPIHTHDLIEGYLNTYLSRHILGKDIMDIKADYFNQINPSNPEVSEMLNTIYGKIYNDSKITSSYKKVIYIFSMIEKIIKSGVMSKKTLISLSRFNQFLEQNGLLISELTNERHDYFTNPVTGTIHDESFLELYQKSIDMTQEAIFEANKYLYGDATLESLNTTFDDLSYETGLSCSIGRKFTYVRKKIKKRQYK